MSFGPNLVSWCVYLMVAHAIPVARCADLVAALTGTRPSDGFVHSLLGRAATVVAETNLLGDRSLDTFEAFMLPDLSGVIVHDRYQNYDAKIFGQLVHQLCVQHLIRDCTDAAETYPDAHWPIQIREALQALIHAANLAREQNLPQIPAHVADLLISAYCHGVRIGLEDVARVPGRKQPKHRALLEDLRDREDDILRFTTDLRIPPTSNQAERDLRPAETQQKISGRFISETVTQDRYAIRGYISTVSKHGADIMTAIRDAILGRPWTPPAWAPG
ncbi:MAG: transposase [Actinoplanes sp.]|nr:transposase [Actinoplanes sp.]